MSKQTRISDELAKQCEAKRVELANTGIRLTFPALVELAISRGLTQIYAPQAPKKAGK